MGKPQHGGNHAQQATVERHAALPHRKNLQRVGEVVAGLVEQAVPQPPANDHAHHAEEKNVLDILARPGAGAGDGGKGLVPQAARAQEHEQPKRHQIRDAVPVNGEGPNCRATGSMWGKSAWWAVLCPQAMTGLAWGQRALRAKAQRSQAWARERDGCNFGIIDKHSHLHSHPSNWFRPSAPWPVLCRARALPRPPPWLQSLLRKRLGNREDRGGPGARHLVRVMRSELSPTDLCEPRGFLATVARGLVANLFRRRTLEQAYLEYLVALPEEQALPSDQAKPSRPCWR